MNKDNGFVFGSGFDSSYISEFEKLGLSYIDFPKNINLPTPVSSHIDMILFYYNDTMFLTSDYYNKHCAYINSIIEKTKINLVITDESVSNKYPNDCLFNILVVGKYAFCKIKSTSKVIIEYLQSQNIKIINVNQGYAKCSTCVVSDKAIISADKGIVAVARENGIDALEIEPGGIDLPPYNYGFIGGASGLVDNTLVFFGYIENHQNSNEIISFLNKHKVEYRCLNESRLLDVGGVNYIKQL